MKKQLKNKVKVLEMTHNQIQTEITGSVYLFDSCPTNKIYCWKCKYYKVRDSAMGCFIEECSKEMRYEYDYSHYWKICAIPPKVKNANNNCTDFELKWWRRIWT